MEETEQRNGQAQGNNKEEIPEEPKKKKKKDEIVAELQQSVAEKEGELKELNNKYLYLNAEFENFKRLKAKEKQDILKFGNETLIMELIPVIDNLERALDHVEKTDESKGILEGVQMTLNSFLKVLERAGVERVEAVGKKFDPNFHEALFQEEREDVEPDTVVSELQKGYLLNGRLIRASRVSVSKKPDIE
ncbi:MAG: heat shock protein GrpE [Syntrophorhabdus sp. PtaU1.Bin153]|nr:MAG: heat shock protein GrpE [Syntrophorhabdus sp. PtaU1.Bin153]